MNFNDDNTSAYDDGYDAAWDGARATHNPFDNDTDGFWNWNRGWEAGNREMQEERECAILDAEEYSSIYD